MINRAHRNTPNDAYYTGLINTHKDLAYSIAIKITQNEQDAEEIVQDAFVKAFRGLDRFRNESSFSTWFYRIVYNAAISATRKKKIQTSDIQEAHVSQLPDAPQIDTLETLNITDRRQIIKAAMQQLNELDYTILTLFYYEEKSLKEIGVIVGKKRNYLKVLLQRARKKLYNQLSDAMKLELKELL